MKNRYRMFIRRKNRGGKVWWCQDYESGKQESLGAKDKNEALQLFALKYQPHQFAGFHLQMARTHLQVGDAETIFCRRSNWRANSAWAVA
jgi:hypothetical protein